MNLLNKHDIYQFGKNEVVFMSNDEIMNIYSTKMI